MTIQNIYHLNSYTAARTKLSRPVNIIQINFTHVFGRDKPQKQA